MSGDHGYDPFGFGEPNPAMEAAVAEIEELQGELARLRAENERLRAALEAVEWLRTGHGGARCPSCGYYFGELDHKRHSHDCPLAAALKAEP